MSKGWTAALAATVVVGAVVLVVHLNKRSEEPPGRSRVVNMVQGFRDDLEATLAETPVNAEHLRAALVRIENERDKWQERSTEAAVLKMQSRIRDELSAFDRAK